MEEREVKNGCLEFVKIIDLVGFPKGDNKLTQDHWEVLTLVVVTVGILLLFLKVSRATGIHIYHLHNSAQQS